MEKLSYVLLVDDDEITNFIHQSLLEQMGVTEKILVAKNGREALSLIQQEKAKANHCPRLVLLDLNMPVMNGFEFLQAYQQLEEKLKRSMSVVLLTTSLNPKDLERVENMGVTDFLSKPLAEEKLKRVLDAHFYNT